ncbi:uncharacterized protein PHALS_06540 [Plasmopara halstedii]|uniref:Uncharacterized protein n=1 Tax=Plasmopara halstedii TaxID=4781 RepID=A0A0P1B350_PLAHL|nr:uncharacterized protein PHALS_06540 [Plasmopara halstedii]CEG48732.1 hypothetical protein PHALS_06540 [Plasmopara halstedii]|eukprot:XP_024585101.1 hypothetical protein PHALS_06540 [Plasmopara halstedii]
MESERRFEIEDEYENEQLLLDLETELHQVQALKKQIQQQLCQLLQDQKYLQQQQQRQTRQNDRQKSGAATARMLHLQEEERIRLANKEAQRLSNENKVKEKANEVQRRQEIAIETQDNDLEDLDAFLIRDASQF